jgi:hypothetical protein
MESAVTVMAVIAGLVFSLSCGLLIEELIFGGIFRMMSAHRGALAAAPVQERDYTNAAKFSKGN